LRITGGTALNRKLKTPAARGGEESIRPTSDRVRESLFAILGERVAHSRVLDLFAGTGALGIEALSRGAASAVFVDRHPRSLDLVRINLRSCFPAADAQLIRLNLAGESSYRTLRRRISGTRAFDIVFLDPPYEKKLAELALTMVEKAGLLAAGGLAVVEERSGTPLPAGIGALSLKEARKYGETGIWIYKAGDTEELVKNRRQSHG
jgi:16S rRNA (guanine966-N2)-methyltransferase